MLGERRQRISTKSETPPRAALLDCDPITTEIDSDEADGHLGALSRDPDLGGSRAAIAAKLKERSFVRIGDRDECRRCAG